MYLEIVEEAHDGKEDRCHAGDLEIHLGNEVGQACFKSFDGGGEKDSLILVLVATSLEFTMKPVIPRSLNSLIKISRWLWRFTALVHLVGCCSGGLIWTDVLQILSSTSFAVLNSDGDGLKVGAWGGNCAHRTVCIQKTSFPRGRFLQSTHLLVVQS